MRLPAVGACRPLSADERELLMGDRWAISALCGLAKKKRGCIARKSAVGSGLHIPSVLMLLSLLIYPQAPQADQRGSVEVLRSQERAGPYTVHAQASR